MSVGNLFFSPSVDKGSSIRSGQRLRSVQLQRHVTGRQVTAGWTVALFVSLASIAAQAQSNSGSIKLNGIVPVTCTVSVSDLGTSLDLVGGESNKQVGSVVENCNSGTGYSVSFESASLGKLTSTGTGSEPVDFSIAYDGQSSSLASKMTLARDSSAFGKTVPVTVSVPANGKRVAGAYADTLTVAIVAK